MDRGSHGECQHVATQKDGDEIPVLGGEEFQEDVLSSEEEGHEGMMILTVAIDFGDVALLTDALGG